MTCHNANLLLSVSSRVAVAPATTQVTFLLLMAYFRPSLKVVIEQPKSSWMFKQSPVKEVLHRWNLHKHLTYLGFFGAPILKGTHLLSNICLQPLVRKATKEAKERHARQVAKTNSKKLAAGKRVPIFWVRGPNGKFHGGPDLSGTSLYPQRFVTALIKCWEESIPAIPS